MVGKAPSAADRSAMAVKAPSAAPQHVPKQQQAILTHVLAKPPLRRVANIGSPGPVVKWPEPRDHATVSFDQYLT